MFLIRTLLLMAAMMTAGLLASLAVPFVVTEPIPAATLLVAVVAFVVYRSQRRGD